APPPGAGPAPPPAGRRPAGPPPAGGARAPFGVPSPGAVTRDPDVFIAEIDVAFDGTDGQRTTMSLVQIFRLRTGQIAMLRDYFTEPPSDAGR
ncbi:hypothetical protein, partial [Micromonospora sp.]|uniref:hypothetical protein n=1 Tax=Micromonospora sp. TaxID=1876 RepID=UPI003B3B097F